MPAWIAQGKTICTRAAIDATPLKRKDRRPGDGGAALTNDTTTNADTTAVRAGFAFDEAALAAWLGEHVAGFAGPLAVSQFSGGQSNPTYLLTTPARRYVLRRKPPGQLLPGAHAVEREAEVLSKLGAVGFPVARVHALCTDDSVIGSWFYVMDMVDGRIFWDSALPQVPAAERPAYCDAMNATIAQLHSLDPVAIGLGDYGKPGNYFARQVARWTRQYLGDDLAGRDAAMDRLVEWLPTAIPPGDETRVVHGDFRCDNMIFHPTEPRVIAVLDWELSTLGHPLADFAYHAMIYRMPQVPLGGLGGRDLAALNLPTEKDYVANYCRRTGRTGIANWDFYLAFNLFRLAAIVHGIKGRALRGNAASAEANSRIAMLPMLSALGCAAMDRCH